MLKTTLLCVIHTPICSVFTVFYHLSWTEPCIFLEEVVCVCVCVCVFASLTSQGGKKTLDVNVGEE